MSKIVFWSPLHGQGQTSNLHILALVMGLLHNKRLLMMQTHFSMNNLERPLVGENVDYCREDSIFQDIGIDAAVMYSRMNLLSANTLESCCLTFPGTSLLLLPGTETKNKETFDRDIGKAVCRMIRHAEEHVDIIMIDANSGNDELSFKLMAMADITIINLTQRSHVLNKFFIEYRERLSNNKVFYLFGNYDKNSAYNINNYRRKYRSFINRNNSGVIPYCTKYMDAQNECDILGMAKEDLNKHKLQDMDRVKRLSRRIFRLGRYSSEETDYFYYQSRRCAEKILNMLALVERIPQAGRKSS